MAKITFMETLSTAVLLLKLLCQSRSIIISFINYIAWILFHTAQESLAF